MEVNTDTHLAAYTILPTLTDIRVFSVTELSGFNHSNSAKTTTFSKLIFLILPSMLALSSASIEGRNGVVREANIML